MEEGIKLSLNPGILVNRLRDDVKTYQDHPRQL